MREVLIGAHSAEADLFEEFISTLVCNEVRKKYGPDANGRVWERSQHPGGEDLWATLVHLWAGSRTRNLDVDTATSSEKGSGKVFQGESNGRKPKKRLILDGLSQPVAESIMVVMVKLKGSSRKV